MKIKYIVSAFLLITLALLYNEAQTFTSRGFGESTGAPLKSGTFTFFGSYPGCASVGCHVGNEINKSGGALEIFHNIPNTGWEPGTTYEIAIRSAYPEKDVHGFQFTAWGDVDSATVGTFSITDTNVQITRSVMFNFSNQPVDTLVYATHAPAARNPNSIIGSTSGEKWWTFNWTAPSVQNQNVIFYATANASNGNGSVTGDFIFKTSLNVGNGGPLNIRQHTKDINWNIYPNPTSDMLSINLQLENTNDFNIDIVDVSGKAVLTKLITPNNNIITEQININNLNSGLYFIKVYNKDFSVVRKINKY